MPHVVGLAVLFFAYKPIQDYLRLYYTARFIPRWKQIVRPDAFLAKIPAAFRALLQENQTVRRHHGGWFSSPPTPDWGGTRPADEALQAAIKLLDDHGEGAVVALALLQTARSPKAFDDWNDSVASHMNDFKEMNYDKLREQNRYPGYNMMCLPGIENTQPIDIALLTLRIGQFINAHDTEADCAGYYWRGNGKAPSSSLDGSYWSYGKSTLITEFLDRRNDWEKRDDWQNASYLRRNRRSLDKLIFAPIEYLAAGAPSWARLIMTYLRCRASDLAYYGDEVADMTFPEPVIKSVAQSDVSSIVAKMANILRDEQRHADAASGNSLQAMHERLTAEAMKDLAKRQALVPVAEYLPARVLTDADVQALTDACRRELTNSNEWNADVILHVIDELVEFCTLLAKPENHIKVPSGQYMEKPTGLRTVADMTNEMAQTLGRLEKFQAYAKIIEDEEGNKWNGRLWTPDYPSTRMVPEPSTGRGRRYDRRLE